MTKKLLILAILLLWTIPALAQVDTAWVRRYNGPGNNQDQAKAIAVDDSGNVHVTGHSFASETWVSSDYATIKYYPNGDTGWARRYNGPGDDYDGASAIATDDSGNVYVTGTSTGTDTYWDYATIKYYPDGDTAWVRRYNGPRNSGDYALAIAVDDSGNTYVTGQSHGAETGMDYATVKYYTNGDTAWVRRYTGSGIQLDTPYGIDVDASCNVYVTGYSVGSGSYEDYATIKYFPNGDTAWVRIYNEPGNSTDWAFDVVTDAPGNVYVTGYSGGDETYGGYATIKYYPNGDTAWVRRYNGPGDSTDAASALQVDGSVNVYVTGRSYGLGSGYDYATIKYYPDGDTAWVRRYNGSGDSTDAATAIAVDSCGNTYVTGYSWNGTDFGYATVKYDSSGNELWVETYNGPGNGDDIAYAIAVCDCDTVYVTGESYGSGSDKDYATIKYVPKEVFVEEENQENIVHSFVLSQNYPNPFNPQTVIEYSLSKSAKVNLIVYNILGQKVRNLVAEYQTNGLKRVYWDGKDNSGKEIASGVYFYQLKIGDLSLTRKLVLLK